MSDSVKLSEQITVKKERGPQSLEEIVALCKRRGFVFAGSDIYGGLQGIYDYGPLGVELKHNLCTAWWRDMVYAREDVEGFDAAIVGHQLMYKYSGHQATFADLMVDCRDCKHRMRADHLVDAKCERCGSTNLTEARQFNLMLSSILGPIDSEKNRAYLRPETAQGIFTNFKNIIDATARKLPFGVAQIGKAFRNEITARNFIFRVREFEQMELEFFVAPGQDEHWHKHWVESRLQWWQQQGLSLNNLELYQQPQAELAHYSKATTDILFRFPHGLEELEGIANRTDYDLGSHSKLKDGVTTTAKVSSNTDSTACLHWQGPSTSEAIVPYVVESSAGVDRGVLALLSQAYKLQTLNNGSTRVVLQLAPKLAPIKVAVVPLAKNKPHIVEKAKQIRAHLASRGWGRIKYEDVGNVGKAYRRHDEIGTPYCVTIDFDTFEQTPATVTVRERDSMQQTRVLESELVSYLAASFI